MKYEKQMWLLDRKIKEAELNTNIKFFIAGGALTSVFSNKAINDLDIFFYRPEHFECMIKDVENKGWKPAFNTVNAMSYNIVPIGIDKPIRIQFIRTYFGLPSEVIGMFDFTICMAAYDPQKKEITLGEDFLYHLSQKTLSFNIKTEYPISSLWRVRKYLKRDFTLPAIECIKIALAINDLQIETYKDLKKQLDGIDTLFLKEVTDAMIEKS